jgi:hypothetical protein
MSGRTAQEISTMSKLTTIETINLIGAIEDSLLLKWKRHSNPSKRIQFLKPPELPPPNNRQGALQMIHTILDLSEDATFIKLRTEVMGHGENETDD